MNRQIPEYLEAEWQTAKDEYKVKTTTYITITKFEYEKLQQENQNLKEEVIALGKGLTKTRIRRDKYKRRYLKEKWKNKQLKKANEILYEENTKLLSVLDEIREYIEKDYGFAKRHDIPLLTKDEQLAGKLFEILDKEGKE